MALLATLSHTEKQQNVPKICQSGNPRAYESVHHPTVSATLGHGPGTAVAGNGAVAVQTVAGACRGKLHVGLVIRFRRAYTLPVSGELMCEGPVMVHHAQKN
jgi:hypothetical protein